MVLVLSTKHVFTLLTCTDKEFWVKLFNYGGRGSTKFVYGRGGGWLPILIMGKGVKTQIPIDSKTYCNPTSVIW